ncbi:sortilin isoform X1 [Rhinichthys klamathensis goyatoka]|uniref:sortilin isoform X1 n=1 Tax=Rhinichthys klamathensis goyatoka TaxID=3034132 RepID=UPI0024B4DAB0|nr:sortilin isoform X1 [Rhinichthys klamathensis goyatoka]
MNWTLLVFGSVCLLVLGEDAFVQGKRDARTVTFSRTARGHSRCRRDTWTGQASFTACKTPLSPKDQEILLSHTHETGFHGDDGSSFTLTWVGDGTGVILVLSTLSALSDSFYEGGSTRLYRSDDYGKSFHDISHAINNTFIKKDFGISAGPGNPQQVILTANLPFTETLGGVILTSMDAGVTFRSVQLPFHPAQAIQFHYQDPKYLVVISIDDGLWFSQDFGNSWSEVHEGVHTFTWGSGITLFFSSSPKGTVEAARRGELILRRTQDFGQTFATIAKNIFSFGYIGGFLFTSVMEKLGSPRVIYVSSDQGDHFKKAQLPSATTEQFYSVLDGDEDMIFMHVDNPGEDTYFGTIYTSDDRGILYSKSLERHLFGGEGKSDFTNVTSLRGVYLTNKLEEDGRIRSVISFDRGGRWRFLNKPENVDCPDNSKKCNLHIHGEHSHFSGITPMLPLSEPTATGLVIAHGSVGDSISAARPDVYVSGDGGYTWWGTLRGPHHYSILDSGGLLVAVEAHRDRQISSIKFSTDEGQCWKTYNFTGHPIFLAGLASEPGTKTMNISIFGYRPDDDDQPMWVAVTIDFEHLLTRECGEQDYVKWLAHSDYDSDPETDGCLLGYKETFRRLKKLSACRNGRGYVVSRQQRPCLCTREDFMCDYGFYRHENSSECLPQPDFLNQTQDICLDGELEDLQTSGYRKIPGDKCEGGFSPTRRNNALKKNCGKDSSPTSSNLHTEKSPGMLVLIVVCTCVGVIGLVITAALIITSRRGHCRQRSPAYRFSVLQLQEDELYVNYESSPNGKINGFQDQEDSDDDLIE